MRLLLDTHTLLWFLTDDRKLSQNARTLIIRPNTDVLVRVVSLWEIVIKASLGKLPLPAPFEELLPAQLEIERISVLQIELQHLTRLRQLPFHHRDPFDRLILAQAIVEKIPLISRDAVFSNYDVPILWNEQTVSFPMLKGRWQ